MDSLPAWVHQYNIDNRPDAYLAKPWQTLLPIATYTESAPDSNAFETVLRGETAPVFPHNLPALAKDYGSGILRQTPFGNTYTADFAKSLIKNYQLGADNVTDFLCISFSSTDYVGHAYGPQSVEVEDTYLRLDRDIADLLQYLDKQVGKNNYTLFLTADHGAVEVPNYLKTRHIPAANFDTKQLQRDLQKFLVTTYQDSLLRKEMNLQIYLDDAKITAKGLDKNAVAAKIAAWLRNYEGVAGAWAQADLQTAQNPDYLMAFAKLGDMPARSGDVFFALLPAWSDYGKVGTTHGSAYPYDTHVPLLFYGKNIPKGKDTKPRHVIDIAATLAQLLSIQMPNGCTGVPIW